MLQEGRPVWGPLIRRVILLAVSLALVVGLLAGLGGGLLAARLDGADPPAADEASTDERIRTAVERVRPNVVLVLADAEDERNVGSGVVVSSNGHVVTNAHVVRGATEISVVLMSGEQRPARLVGDDWPFTDLAMLEVPSQGLRQVAFGRSGDLKAGDLVLSVSGGTGAFGPGNAVTLGVVSGIERTLARSGMNLEDLIQTDAAINNGDSGGALINLRGEIVGITTTVLREGPGGQQIRDVGFAQASDAVRPIVTAMVNGAAFPRARIGIELPDAQHIEITPELAQQHQLPVPQGAAIVQPAPNSPAARAGIVPGDIVIGVNGAPVTLDVPFVNLLKRVPRGQRVDLAVFRGGQTVVVSMQPQG
jgi:2-alkenal reductase